MKSLKIIVILLFVFASASAQSHDTIYFDSNWKEIAGRKNASYYRLHKEVGGKLIVTDYFMDGTPQMIAEATQFDTLIKEGKCVFYKKYKGRRYKSSEGNYVKDLREGEWKVYDEKRKGVFCAKGDYLNDRRDGRWEFFNEMGKLYAVVHYDRGRAFGSTEWYQENGDILTEIYYVDSVDSWYYFKNFILNYPVEIVNEKDDTVFVKLDVDSTGLSSNVKISRSQNPSLNQVALDYINSMKYFKPATKNYHPYNSGVEIPLVFRSRKEIMEKEKSQ